MSTLGKHTLPFLFLIFNPLLTLAHSSDRNRRRLIYFTLKLLLMKQRLNRKHYTPPTREEMEEIFKEKRASQAVEYIFQRFTI
jgi:hypothetical protein